MAMLRPLLVVATAFALAAPVSAQEPTTRPTTQPTTQPTTRPADLGEFATLLYDAAEVYIALDIEERGLLQSPAEPEATAVLDKLRPLVDRAMLLDLSTLDVPQVDPIDFDPRLVAGMNTLTAAVVGEMARERSPTREQADAAARRMIAVAGLLRPFSEITGTSFWFRAVRTDASFTRWFAVRSVSLSPETRLQMATLPPLRPFHESTGEEGKLLVERLRASDELPEFVTRAAFRIDEADREATIESWRADWANPETKKKLIDEYELYFDVEVEIAALVGEPEQLAEFLDEWERGHENESLWLSRYTLQSPREAYADQYRQRVLRELLAVGVSGIEQRNFGKAVNAVGTVSTGAEIELSQQREAARLRADVPLADAPADLYFSR